MEEEDEEEIKIKLSKGLEKSFCYRGISVTGGSVIHFLGSGPIRARSPLEWGDFQSVCLFVRLSVPPSGLSSQA